MLTRVIAVAVFAGLVTAGTGFAQTDGPAELPAADYPGQSYVDSHGCVFLKAGYGGTAEWVPRVDQDRKPVCGQSPTNAVKQAPVSAARTADQPVKSVAKTRHVRKAAPTAPLMITCPVSVPVPRRYATTDGGSVLVCTASNGSLTGARSPIYPAGSAVGAALSPRPHTGVIIPLPETQKAGPARTAAAAHPAAYTGGAAYYVQVGSFAVPANADGAKSRLVALGLPVAKGKFTLHGRPLQVIYAGPFSSGNEAETALNAARGIGFSDAFVR